MRLLQVRVPGDPIPQGSMRWLPNKRVTDANPRLHSWRADVAARLSDAHFGNEAMAGPVYVWLDFFIRRPLSHHGAHGIRHSAPARPIGAKNDLDKLCRAVLDAATAAGVWYDDGQVVFITASKHWADHEGPGVAITIQEREERDDR